MGYVFLVTFVCFNEAKTGEEVLEFDGELNVSKS
jgi:hypothetical protein